MDTLDQAADRAGGSAGNKGYDATAAAIEAADVIAQLRGAHAAIETKGRARALQLLYAWELQSGPPVPAIATGLARLTGSRQAVIVDRAEALAEKW